MSTAKHVTRAAEVNKVLVTTTHFVR